MPFSTIFLVPSIFYLLFFYKGLTGFQIPFFYFTKIFCSISYISGIRFLRGYFSLFTYFIFILPIIPVNSTKIKASNFSLYYKGSKLFDWKKVVFQLIPRNILLRLPFHISLLVALTPESWKTTLELPIIVLALFCPIKEDLILKGVSIFLSLGVILASQLLLLPFNIKNYLGSSINSRNKVNTNFYYKSLKAISTPFCLIQSNYQS